MDDSRVVFHYWCGRAWRGLLKNRYVKYLLVSVESLLRTSNVSPSDVYVSLDKEFLVTPYAQAVVKLGVNVLEAPPFRNHAKVLCYTDVMSNNPDITHLVQIDCDCYVNYPNAVQDVLLCDKAISIRGRDAGAKSTEDLINLRGGQAYNCQTVFSLLQKQEDRGEYESFKRFAKEYVGADLDWLVEQAKSIPAFYGWIYVIRPQLLPPGFFKFVRFFNYFFEDDEVSLAFAKIHFNLEYDTLEDKIQWIMSENIDMLYSGTGFRHFPEKEEEIEIVATAKADKLVSLIL